MSLYYQVGRDISAKSLSEKQDLCIKLFNEYSQEEWKKCCEHVKKIELEYWERDHVIDDEIDRIIISLNDDDSVDSVISDDESD